MSDKGCKMTGWRAALCVTTALVGGATGLDNGLGLTPPMGYNAYDHVGCCVSTQCKAAQNYTTDSLLLRLHKEADGIVERVVDDWGHIFPCCLGM